MVEALTHRLDPFVFLHRGCGDWVIIATLPINSKFQQCLMALYFLI